MDGGRGRDHPAPRGGAVLGGQWRAGRQAGARGARVPRAVPLPDAALGRPRPGAGPVLAPRLRAAGGDQRERSPRAAAGPQAGGPAPVTERRGHQGGGPWRLPGPPVLRQRCGAGAAPAIPPAYGARAIDDTPRPKGSSPQAARRAPADDATSLNALKRRGSPVARDLQTPSTGSGPTTSGRGLGDA